MEAPKHNREAEMAILWSILIDKDIVVDAVSQLEAEDFYDNDTSIIYKAMSYMAVKNIPIDLLTLKDQLEHMDIKLDNPKYKSDSDVNPFIKSNELIAVWWITFLTDLTEIVPTSSNYLEHIKTIKRYSQLRKIRQVVNLCNKNIDNNLWPEEVLKFLETWIRKVVSQQTSWDIYSLDEIMIERMEELAEGIEWNDSTKTLVTGYKDLDSMTWPMMPWNLVLVWARPSMWKSAFVMNVINNNMIQGKRIAFFSLEMNKREIVNRLISMHTDINSFQLKNWTNKPSNVDKEVFLEWRAKQHYHISEQLDELLWSKLFIDDSTNLTPKKIRARLARLTLEEELDLIVIDYIWLMKSDSKWLNKTNETWDISRELKILAWEHNCPVIALSQLSREVETRANKKPIMKDLRNSGDLEQDSNMILFLYREKAYDEFSFDDTLQVIVSKNRDWGKWTVRLEFNLQKQLITNCSKEKINSLMNN